MPDRVISLTPEEVNRMLATGEMRIISTPSDKDYAEPDKPWPQTEAAQKLIGLGYTRKQAAFSPDEITEKTKVYVGPLVNKDPSGEIIPIFQQLTNAELILAPEGEVRVEELTIGGKDKNQLKHELELDDFIISQEANYMMDSRYFKTAKDSQAIRLIKLPIKVLGFERTGTMDQIYQRAGLLGLDLCPVEVGPHLRLKDKDQPLDDMYWIGMKQIIGRDGNPCVFNLVHIREDFKLSTAWADPGDRWDASFQFVFTLNPPI